MKHLGLAAAICVLGGCLIPQEESYLSEIPIQRNRPPRIVESHASPTERIIRGYGSDLCNLEFSVIVEDPDVDNRLLAYWFIDYDPNQTRGEDDLDLIKPKDRKIVRDDRASFQVNFGSADFNRLNVPGDHIIEVVVTDTSLVRREPEAMRIPLADGNTLTDPGYTATYVWFVRTEAGGDCP